MQPNLESSLLVDFTKVEKGYENIFKRSPLISSASIGWDDLGITVAYDQQPPF